MEQSSQFGNCMHAIYDFPLVLGSVLSISTVPIIFAAILTASAHMKIEPCGLSENGAKIGDPS